MLNLFDIKPLRPVILAVGSSFEAREAGRALEFCVSLAVRLMITGGTRTGSVEEGLADAAHRVYRSKIKDTRSLIAALGDVTPSGAPFVLGVRDGERV